jgi:hypothetical protein
LGLLVLHTYVASYAMEGIKLTEVMKNRKEKVHRLCSIVGKRIHSYIQPSTCISDRVTYIGVHTYIHTYVHNRVERERLTTYAV